MLNAPHNLHGKLLAIQPR